MKENSLKATVFALCFTIMLVGLSVGSAYYYFKSKAPNKTYPIEVIYGYDYGYNVIRGSMQADSVKDDTVYKDGMFILNKNILNVSFK